MSVCFVCERPAKIEDTNSYFAEEKLINERPGMILCKDCFDTAYNMAKGLLRA